MEEITGILQGVEVLGCWSDDNLQVVRLKVDDREFYRSKGELNEKVAYVRGLESRIGKRVKLRFERVKDNVIGWAVDRLFGVKHPIDYYEVVPIDGYQD